LRNDHALREAIMENHHEMKSAQKINVINASNLIRSLGNA